MRKPDVDIRSLDLKPVQELADDLRQRIGESTPDADAFTRIAESALSEARLHESLTPSAISRAVLTEGGLPFQLDPKSEFGQPAITLASDPSFVIDAYFWQSAPTGIHNHNFSGAFSPIAGRSLHCMFNYTTEQSWDGGLRFGVLDLTNAEVLLPGDVRPIWGREDAVHQVWHVARPTITIVVRSYEFDDDSVIYPHFPPGFSVRGLRHQRLRLHKRLQMLDYMLRFEPEQAVSALQTAMAVANDCEAFWLLRSAFSGGIGEDTLARILEKSPLGAHGWADAFFKSLSSTHLDKSPFPPGLSDDERFMLCLLLSVPDREEIFRLLRENGCSDPANSAAEWICELSNKHALDLAFNETAQIMMGALLADRDPMRAAESLSEHYDIGDLEPVRQDAEALLKRLSAHAVLGPLFQGAPSPA